jgi:pyrroloquinoline quinone (PQQ) biosynthesis protein C
LDSGILSEEASTDEQCESSLDGSWIDTLKLYVRHDWQDLVEGEWATKVKNATWSTDAMRGWFLQLYPFIHAFPKFLAEALIKVEDDFSRSFLINNIKVEKAHAEHWLWMGEGFGIPRSEMLALAEGQRTVLRDVQSLTDWIWYVNAKGTLAEAVAATSFAIEGGTGDLTRALLEGFMSYGSREGVTMNSRTTKWFRNHARYDDDHPRIALQVVARYAKSERERRKVMIAARRSLQLLNLALLTSSRTYSMEAPAGAPIAHQMESPDRRGSQHPIPFPDRRIVDRHRGAISGAAREIVVTREIGEARVA